MKCENRVSSTVYFHLQIIVIMRLIGHAKLVEKAIPANEPKKLRVSEVNPAQYFHGKKQK